MAAIWKDLSSAFCDCRYYLLNLNALLELGMAMALGKPTRSFININIFNSIFHLC
ncbi:MAG: hypothetical protein HWD58_12860 [Bacteroidota bacterium]|nr:MAG: hypothetical protein HWD58_12860 [Bacteroidota bacterium]